MTQRKPTTKVQVSNVLRKTYAYTKGDVNLQFALRVDIPQELESFKELLGIAREEVSKDLEELKRHNSK